MVWLTLLALLAPYTVCAEQLEPVKLRLKWYHQFQFAGFYAAKEQGYYSAAGLEVEILEFTGGEKSNFEQVAEGSVDYAIQGPALLLHYIDGLPLVALAAIFQHSASAMLVLAESELHTPQDLVGKPLRLGDERLSAEIYAMFRKEGVDVSQLVKLNTPWKLDPLLNGTIQSMSAYTTNTAFPLDELGVKYRFISPITYGIDFYGDVLFTSQREVEQNPQRVEKFLRASLKGWDYAMAHPEELVEVIFTQYPNSLTPKTRAGLMYEYRQIKKLILPELVQMGHINPGRWKHIADTYHELGFIDKQVNLNGFIYDPHSHDGLSLFAQRIIIGVLLAFALVVLVLLLFNNRLHAKVERRTKDLRISNDHLREEFAKRQQALEFQSRLTTILQATSDLVGTFTPAGEMIFMNQSMRNFLAVNLTANEEPLRIQALYGPEKDALLNEVMQLAKEHGIWQGESIFVSQEGTEVPMSQVVIAHKNPEGNIEFFSTIARDISNAKAVERQLKENNRFIEKITDTVPSVIYIYDLQLRQNIYANYELIDLLGYDRQDMAELGEDLMARLIHPEDAEKVRLHHEQLLNLHENKFLELEYRVISKTGQVYWLLSRDAVFLRDKSNQVLQILGSANNITQRKLVEEELAHKAHNLELLNEELKRSNQELDDFAYIASHDLKEPLRGINAYSQFILEDYYDKLDQSGQEKLNHLTDMTQRMTDLIETLLYFSRVGRTELDFGATDLNQVVQRVLQRMRYVVEEQGIEIRMPQPLPTVDCNANRVEEVFHNLVSNAIKYNDKNEKWVEIGCIEQHPPVLYVKDNGIGIQEHHQENIFRIFKRLHARNRYGGGIGAGLTFAKKIIERHHGKIWVESTFGEGTTFFFTLSTTHADENQRATPGN